jgi:hypothetical protein
VKQFTAGIKMQFLKGDTLAVSKDGLPASLEIRVMPHHGIGVMD